MTEATQTEYGNFFTLEGTLADVMTKLIGTPRKNIISIFYDGTDTTAIVSR